MPCLQRENNLAIMEVFCGRLPGATHRKLNKYNQVQLYLRVVTLADLVELMGYFILDGMLTGDWQAGADLE